jgi:hypothetical protein
MENDFHAHVVKLTEYKSAVGPEAVFPPKIINFFSLLL